YNGHFACTCYHPLFVFNQFGDLERCALRSGNVHSAHGWKEVVEPVVARYRGNELIEHEHRMIAGASEVAVVGGAFLITVGWADTRIHVEHDCPRRLAGMNA